MTGHVVPSRVQFNCKWTGNQFPFSPCARFDHVAIFICMAYTGQPSVTFQYLFLFIYRTERLRWWLSLLRDTRTAVVSWSVKGRILSNAARYAAPLQVAVYNCAIDCFIVVKDRSRTALPCRSRRILWYRQAADPVWSPCQRSVQSNFFTEKNIN